MAISFSGLSTGFDTEALVEQLLQVERIPAQRLETRKTNADRRLTIVNDLISNLKSLKTAMASLDTSAEVRSVAATSSDEAKLRVASSGAAQPAQLTMHVNTLARAQTSVSTVFASTGAGVAGAGILGIRVGSAPEQSISFSGQDTLTDIVNRINDDVEGVRAELLNTGSGYRISITSEQAGAASALSFTAAGESLGFLAPESVAVAAQDASFTVNGIAFTRPTNTVSDAIEGLTFTLVGQQAPGDSDISVSVERDPEGTQSKVESLVNAFNAVADLVNAQMTFSGVQRGEDTLFGDTAVRALQRRLSEVAGAKYPHDDGTVTLSQFGIRLGRDGKLTIDSAVLADAVAEDPTAIEDLLAGQDGLATAVNDMVEQFTRTGDGFLTAKKSALSAEMNRFDDQIERIETRAGRMGDQLRAQFNALESLMSDLQSQQAALASLFG